MIVIYWFILIIINKYVYKHLLNILKYKPYLKTFDDEYNYYYIDFVNLQEKKYNID